MLVLVVTEVGQFSLSLYYYDSYRKTGKFLFVTPMPLLYVYFISSNTRACTKSVSLRCQEPTRWYVNLANLARVERRTVLVTPNITHNWGCSFQKSRQTFARARCRMSSSPVERMVVLYKNTKIFLVTYSGVKL